MPPTARRKSPAAIAAAAMAVCVAVFALPYLVPVRHGFSPAYAFGWNTRAAEIILVLAVGTFAWWTDGLHLPLPPADMDPAPLAAPTRGPLAFTMAATALVCIAVWLCTRPAGAMQEAAYFLDRYADFQLGARLYRDIEFSYGPLMFYPPVWLSHATGMLLGDAYFLFWTVQAVAGTAVLWSVVRVAAAGTRYATALYLLLWAMLSMALVDGGANYTALRFTAALAVALAARRALVRGRSPYAVLTAAAAGAALLFFYSPEIGLQCWLGLSLFLLLGRPMGLRRCAGPLLLGSVLFAAAIAASIPTGELTVLREFSGGALALPMLPGLGTLVDLAALLLGTCVAVRALRTNRSAHPLVLLLALALVGLPGGMGRCDPGHLMLYTLGAWIAAGAALSNLSEQSPAPEIQASGIEAPGIQAPEFEASRIEAARLQAPRSEASRLSRAAFVLALANAVVGFAAHAVLAHGIFFVPLRAMAVQDGGHAHPVIRALYAAAMRRGLGREAADRKLAAFDAETAAPAHPLPPGTTVMAPLGALRTVVPWPGALRIDSGRYPAWIESTPTVAQEKAAELAAHPTAPVLLPDGWQGLCAPSPRDMRRFQETVFLTPLVPPVRHPIPTAAPLCRYLEQHYAPSRYTAPMIGFEVWTPAQPYGPGSTSVIR